MVVFYESLVGKTNYQTTVVFVSCLSFSLPPSWPTRTHKMLFHSYLLAAVTGPKTICSQKMNRKTKLTSFNILTVLTNITQDMELFNKNFFIKFE